MNNESADIIRMLISAFDHLLPLERQEANKGSAALVPTLLEHDIDELNSWVYDTINNGVYRIGFATSQTAYDEHITKLFASLDRLEQLFSEPGHQPYIFGQYITEADIRLYTTLVRFDVVYYTLFKCNTKMIRMDYPQLHAWLRRLYWNEGPETAGGAFKKSTHFDVVSTDTLHYNFSQLIGLDQAWLRIGYCGQRNRTCWTISAYHAFVTSLDLTIRLY